MKKRSIYNYHDRKRNIRTAAVLMLAVIPYFGGALLTAAYAQDILDGTIRIEAAVDKKEALIGDTIIYSIDVYSSQPDCEVRFPEFDKPLDIFEVKGRVLERPWCVFGKRRQSARYSLAAYEVGSHTIPPVKLKYRLRGGGWHEFSTDALKVTIQSVLAQSPEAKDIKDIKGPVRPGERRMLLALLAAALTMLAIFSAVYVVKKRITARQDALFRTAYDIASLELEDIERRGLMRQGKIREFYTRLSDCIRRYLENRFFFRASEMTTEEFLESVRESEFLSAGSKALLKEFLASCDMVKFARYGPDKDEIISSFEKAKHFIERTKEAINEEPSSRRTVYANETKPKVTAKER